MGQTLTHGIYLPDEGERNCYNGLAANWSILDGAVGTIAEHTTALAGKAPASHTHGNLTNDGKIGTTANVPLITGTDGVVQAGSFGNAANTFCEGNDSRLSDARTPVAHTHVTADVTDLLNTTHEWTKEQVCDEGFTAKSTTIERCVTPETIKHINFTFKDKNDKGIGAVRRYFRNNGIQELQVFGNTRIKDSQYDETGSDVFFGFSESIKPNGTKTFTFDGYMGSNLEPLSANQSIGSVSNQWNNLYAKNYYYNGVAWGLDKANTWTKTQNFVGEYQGTEYSFRYHSCFVLYGTEDTVGKSGMTITKWRPGKNQGALISTDFIQFGIDVTENEVRTQNVFNIQASGYNSNNGQFNTCSLTSKMENCNLGSTDNKWTINGLNPGRISLPRYTASVAQDISGNMIPDQYNNIKFTSNLDGWMYIDFNVSSATLLSGADYLVQSKDNNLANATHVINFVKVVGNHIFVYQPVLKNEYIILEVNFSGFSIGKAYIYPCQGTII